MVAVLAVVIPVLLALFLARRITRPLRRLTAAAAQIREDLPKMVEQMATPGEGPELTIPEIPVNSNDEVGRLAKAFNDVNKTTVATAQEQAALRGSIAAMFVNVARRDQVLLSRQLSFLDQLERTEENPETLDNLFKLDHLATRMRRNAESLLVLAGIDTGRRLRRPMPLADVVRTASSEIEHYERVDLAQHVDPPMVGHAALIAAHMLAELLENATAFSDPGSRVLVTTDNGPVGVRLTITDEGLGMSAEELDEANDRIQNPPVSEVVGAQRLGFYVVGRLARRLEASVTLSPGDGRGTIATVDLPAALFSPGSVEDPSAPAVEAAAAPQARSHPRQHRARQRRRPGPRGRGRRRRGRRRRQPDPAAADRPVGPRRGRQPAAAQHLAAQARASGDPGRGPRGPGHPAGHAGGRRPGPADPHPGRPRGRPRTRSSRPSVASRARPVPACSPASVPVAPRPSAGR